MDVMAKSSPLELVFESKYGKIIGYSVFGDGYIVIGFHEGTFYFGSNFRLCLPHFYPYERDAKRGSVGEDFQLHD